ncbi:MAG: LOG family protein [Gammaproteobacteria bacterium]|nr:LOG family protein [Gammaproteobacteria bacterium]MBU1489941.1 LOG family protein [Gammaproteobacteria bacterium]MBU2064876.1 LOG family protein [Gammaproteobacteria bacterium]MBU2324368.1 LOG family protein [Gammaproteobacteria bacterium]
MPDTPDDYLSRHFQTSEIDLGERITALATQVTPPGSANLTLYRDMLATVARMAQADRNRWDAKIMLQTLRELEQAFSLLERFKRRRKVTVFGSARTPPKHPIYALARELGSALARHDLMVITGAGGGVMAAAHEGAGADNSLGFNIALPFEQRPNATLTGSSNLLPFHFFFLRKLFFVKEADGLVLCPGGFGTLDEALEVLTLVQTGKSPLVPIVLLDQPGGTFWQDALTFIRHHLEDNGYILSNDLNLLRLVYSAEEATEEITAFYRNYHSSRRLNGRFVVRLRHALSDRALQQLDNEFRDLCREDGFSQCASAADEVDEPELRHLTRLAFTFNGRDYGRLRQLIDLINRPENWCDPTAVALTDSH